MIQIKYKTDEEKANNAKMKKDRDGQEQVLIMSTGEEEKDGAASKNQEGIEEEVEEHYDAEGWEEEDEEDEDEGNEDELKNMSMA